MKNLLKSLLFTGLFCLLFAGACFLFKPVGGYFSRISDQPEGMVDLLFIGSSQVYCDVNPVVLWEEYGIPAFNYVTPAQPAWVSYYFLQDALAYQDPKVIVVEVNSVVESFENYQVTEARSVAAMDAMELSLLKLEMFRQLDPAGEGGLSRYLFGLSTNHSRWKEMEEGDVWYRVEDSIVNRYKGYGVNRFDEIAPQRPPGGEYAEEAGELDEKNRYFLEAILDFAEEENLPLLLMKTPSVTVRGDGELQGRLNAVAALAEERGVPFWDLNRDMEEIAFDYSTDFFNRAHLNKYGAERLSRYLGRRLAEEYGLEDRRGEPGFDSWEEDARSYFYLSGFADLRATGGFQEYARLLPSLREELVLATCGYLDPDCYGPVWEELENWGGALGWELAPEMLGSNYLCLWDLPGDFRAERWGSLPLSLEATRRTYSSNVELHSDILHNAAGISVEGTEYPPDPSCLNVVLYHPASGQVVDCFLLEPDGEGRLVLERGEGI